MSRSTPHSQDGIARTCPQSARRGNRLEDLLPIVLKALKWRIKPKVEGSLSSRRGWIDNSPKEDSNRSTEAPRRDINPSRFTEPNRGTREAPIFSGRKAPLLLSQLPKRFDGGLLVRNYARLPASQPLWASNYRDCKSMTMGNRSSPRSSSSYSMLAV